MLLIGTMDCKDVAVVPLRKDKRNNGITVQMSRAPEKHWEGKVLRVFSSGRWVPRNQGWLNFWETRLVTGTPWVPHEWLTALPLRTIRLEHPRSSLGETQVPVAEDLKRHIRAHAIDRPTISRVLVWFTRNHILDLKGFRNNSRFNRLERWLTESLWH